VGTLVIETRFTKLVGAAAPIQIIAQLVAVAEQRLRETR